MFLDSILPEKTTFNVDNVRVCKILVIIIHYMLGIQLIISKYQVPNLLKCITNIYKFVFYIIVYLKYVILFQGSNLFNSSVVNGMVFKRTNEGDITKQINAKIAVFTCPIDITTTETKVNKTIFYIKYIL